MACYGLNFTFFLAGISFTYILSAIQELRTWANKRDRQIKHDDRANNKIFVTFLY